MPRRMRVEIDDDEEDGEGEGKGKGEGEERVDTSSVDARSQGAAATATRILLNSVTRARSQGENVHASGEDGDAEANANANASHARCIMNLLDEHSQTFPEQLYIDLCNHVGELSKVERQSKRMRARLVEYDGSDCSVLIPSEVGAQLEEGMYDWDEDDEDEPSLASSDGIYGGFPRSRPLHVARIGHGELSGLKLRVHGKDYWVPKKAVKRDYNCIVKFQSAQDHTNATRRGTRTTTWRALMGRRNVLTLPPEMVVVLEMTSRTGERMFLWTSRVTYPGQNCFAEAAVLAILPIAIAVDVYEHCKADPQLQGSRLATAYPPHRGACPLPGPSQHKRRYRLPDLEGNYWPQCF